MNLCYCTETFTVFSNSITLSGQVLTTGTFTCIIWKGFEPCFQIKCMFARPSGIILGQNPRCLVRLLSIPRHALRRLKALVEYNNGVEISFLKIKFVFISIHFLTCFSIWSSQVSFKRYRVLLQFNCDRISWKLRCLSFNRFEDREETT